MSRCSNRSILSLRHSSILGTVACLCCWSAAPSATAQQSESPLLVAFLSVDTVRAESTRSNVSERTGRQILTEREIEPILVPHRKPTDHEAWERFEAEYKLPIRSPSAIKRQIETAKYGLDTAVFAVDRFTKSVQNQADFSYDQGSLRRTRETSFGESPNKLRVKLDLEMWQGSRPYVGVRLVIPFGN